MHLSRVLRRFDLCTIIEHIHPLLARLLMILKCSGNMVLDQLLRLSRVSRCFWHSQTQRHLVLARFAFMEAYLISIKYPGSRKCSPFPKLSPNIMPSSSQTPRYAYATQNSAAPQCPNALIQSCLPLPKPRHHSIPSILHTIPHAPPHPLLKLFAVLPPQLPRLNIRRRLIIRTPQHTDNAQQNRLRRLYRTPPLTRILISILILSRRMQDTDTDLPILIDVRMENRRFEFQFRWIVGVIGWERHSSAETASAVEGVLFVGEHEHDFPFEDVGIYEANAYAGYVFICLHLFVLLAEDEGCAGGAARRGGVASIGGRSHGGVEGGGVARSVALIEAGRRVWAEWKSWDPIQSESCTCTGC
ncbi:hypothetical protein CB0940_11891 [Cercospora beticola]|uniref:Uncharacterized protein n=1 Tax=Cercospora beticola TaxID=122368 RepID=A0A2G5IEH0_CERBT|nr:hypothetical protein CB0940_11891 [Cercospora beticola]PIB02863.1 hypothetical protein CB0940_11891 [Cercospora beticola]